MLKILIVDDETSRRGAVAGYLSIAGHCVDSAAEAEEAQALLANFEFDIVATGLRLSSLDRLAGLRVVASVRERSTRTSVAVMSECDRPEIEAEARKLGADLFLRTPMAFDELAARLTAMHEELAYA